MPSISRSVVVLALVAGLTAACGSAASQSPALANPTAAPAASITPAPPSTSALAATPWPSSPGTGAQHVVGTGTTDPSVHYTSSPGPDGVTYLRGGALTGSLTANDPRATGTTKFEFNVDAYGTVGPEWGTLTIANGQGTWSGACSGASWGSGDLSLMACWLVGGGSYKGSTYYVSLSTNGFGGTSEGIIYPGSAPTF